MQEFATLHIPGRCDDPLDDHRGYLSRGLAFGAQRVAGSVRAPGRPRAPQDVDTRRMLMVALGRWNDLYHGP